MDWVALGSVIACGAFGGLINAVLSGGESYEVRLPGRASDGRAVHLGFTGPMIVGTGAALVAWGGALAQLPASSFPTVIVGCLLAGISGGHYLTSQAKIQNLEAAQHDAVSAMTDAAVAAKAMADQASSNPE